MAAGVRDDVSRNYTCCMRRGEDNVFMDISYPRCNRPMTTVPDVSSPSASQSPYPDV
jgi:hypothetical protein